jgi:hypothetical protein
LLYFQLESIGPTVFNAQIVLFAEAAYSSMKLSIPLPSFTFNHYSKAIKERPELRLPVLFFPLLRNKQEAVVGEHVILVT